MPSTFARAIDAAPPPVVAILDAYARATHGTDAATIETQGTIAGEGLSGTFHTWRDDTRERDDEALGPRSERSLRIGDRTWVRNGNGNVQELTGVLKRRALTTEFIDSGAFLKAPERVRFAGFGTIAKRRVWKIDVSALGGDPETLWIDPATGLPLRTEYLDGDGPTYVDLSDWRDVNGMKMAFHSVTTDGERDFDIVQQTLSVKINQPIAAGVFAPLEGHKLIAEGVQTVPLLDDGRQISCSVTISGRVYTFLIDSGSGNILLDARASKTAGLRELGSLEVRGASRSGGMHVATLPMLTIGTAGLHDLVVSTLDLGMGGAARIDGILGYPFFATSLVQLDFTNRVMRFGPPGSFVPTGDRIPLDTDREIPEAVLRINDRFDAPFIIDTGNTGNVLLYAPFVTAHPGLAPTFGGPGSSFAGVGGANRTYETHLESLRLGTTVLANQPGDVIMAKSGAFADRIDAGNIGLGVLRKFTVTFDYANHALYLDRGSPPTPAPPRV